MHEAFPFSVDLMVRGYELDAWNHVNNAVYMQWLEHARWEMSRRLQLDMFAGGGVLPVIRYVDLDFRTETRLGDSLRVSLWPRSLGRTSFTLGGAIRILDTDPPHDRAGNLALVSTQVLTCIEPGHGKVAVPEAWRAMFPEGDPGFEPPKEV